jgi:hypothetical protein
MRIAEWKMVGAAFGRENKQRAKLSFVFYTTIDSICPLTLTLSPVWGEGNG